MGSINDKLEKFWVNDVFYPTYFVYGIVFQR